jgi:hypothetical protein
MRGTDERSGKLFSYVDLEQRVPAGHPLRAIRGLVNDTLTDIGPELEVALACHLNKQAIVMRSPVSELGFSPAARANISIEEEE